VTPLEIIKNEENNCIILIEEYFSSENLQEIIINRDAPLQCTFYFLKNLEKKYLFELFHPT